MFLRLTASVASLLATFALHQVVSAYEYQPYFYTIYYDLDDCGEGTVSLIGHSDGDDEYTMGGADNVTFLCSIESACLINNKTDLCMNLEYTGESPVLNQVDNEGRVFQCDGTNDSVDQGECRFLDQCYGSSVYPQCHFRLRTTAEIFTNKSLVRNVNAFEDDGLDHQSYLIMYSDDECSEFEGAHGIIAGETPLKMTHDTMTCEESVACAFLPEGAMCQNNGGVTGEITTLYTQKAASKAIVCDDATGANCEEIEPSACIKSEIYPSCYIKHVTAKAFFAEPETYVVGTKYLSDVTVEPAVDSPPTQSPTVEEEGDSDSDGAIAVRGVMALGAMALGLVV